MYNDTRTDNYGVTTPTSDTVDADPLAIAPQDQGGGLLTVGFEHCVEQGSASRSLTWPDGSGGSEYAQDDVVYSRTADTVMKLFTGGKAMSGRQNLFLFERRRGPHARDDAEAKSGRWCRLV